MVGRDHHHPQLLRAHRHVPRVSGAVLREQIAAYDQLPVRQRLPDTSRAHRNILKPGEAESPARRAPQSSARRGEKDDGLVFDELGLCGSPILDESLFQELRDTDQDGARVWHPDRGQRTRLRPVHENPVPAPAPPLPWRHHDRHAHQQHDGRTVYGATLPRPGAGSPQPGPL